MTVQNSLTRTHVHLECSCLILELFVAVASFTWRRLRALVLQRRQGGVKTGCTN